jgi:hypothetical protein
MHRWDRHVWVRRKFWEFAKRWFLKKQMNFLLILGLGFVRKSQPLASGYLHEDFSGISQLFTSRTIFLLQIEEDLQVENKDINIQSTSISSNLDDRFKRDFPTQHLEFPRS